jgi:ribosomal protein L37AE/L43A
MFHWHSHYFYIPERIMCKSQTPDRNFLPNWAQRVPKSKIKQLYELDAKRICDEDFLDEVGYALYARCQSIIEACRATFGEVICPVCSAIISHNQEKERLLTCPGCDWQLTWGTYFAIIQHKQLSGAETVLELFREYINKFPKANSDREKMFCIDKLLHGCHWSVRYGPTRPVAINLIKGRLSDVIQFLDALSYGLGSTPGIKQNQTEWIEKSQNARNWVGKK